MDTPARRARSAQFLILLVVALFAASTASGAVAPVQPAPQRATIAPLPLAASTGALERSDPQLAPAPAAAADPVRLPDTSTSPYHGRNHVWIPSLGISKSVQSYPCSRSRPPDAGVYRWGCAGHNNVYLLSHAWSTFKPLHDAYAHGRLRKGMRVWYADASGHVHRYVVVWWKLTRPTNAEWAWAAQSRPSMTLQTCYGSRSQYRLVVRLVAG